MVEVLLSVKLSPPLLCRRNASPAAVVIPKPAVVVTLRVPAGLRFCVVSAPAAPEQL